MFCNYKFQETTILVQISSKIEKSSKIGQNKKSLIPFFAYFFDWYCQTLISWRETDHWAIPTPKFEICLIFPNFQGSSLALHTKFVILDIKVRFSCGESDLYQTIVKFQNILTRIDWKFLLCSLHSQWRLKFLEKAIICLKNVSSINNLPIIKVERFLKSSFDLNQIC